jgi:hypothetical protein
MIEIVSSMVRKNEQNIHTAGTMEEEDWRQSYLGRPWVLPNFILKVYLIC